MSDSAEWDENTEFHAPDREAFIEAIMELEMERRAWEDTLDEAGLSHILDPPRYPEG